MGYKLAGMNVIGCCEIDKQMFKTYTQNFHVEHPFNMSIVEFNQIPDTGLPSDLFTLDILDGSPPCSSFSMAGSREKKWGTKTKFREGQAHQVLDELFFHWIATVNKLKPKIAIAENVTGILRGNAKWYVVEIIKKLEQIGYTVQLFKLNASRMGVPQYRERVFFIARQPHIKSIDLQFDEPLITVAESWKNLELQTGNPLTEFTKSIWKQAVPGESMRRVNNGNGFNNLKIAYNTPAATFAASGGKYHPLEPRNLSPLEMFRIQTFPDDYNTDGIDPEYVCGMSVPPRMIQRIAEQIEIQMLGQSIE